MIVLVCVGVIVWVWKLVCGLGSLDCCCKVYVCWGEGEGEVGVDVCVGVIVWVRMGVCGWGSLDCCRKVSLCVCVWGIG